MEECPHEYFPSVTAAAALRLEKNHSRMRYNQLVSEVRRILDSSNSIEERKIDTLFIEACLQVDAQIEISHDGWCALAKWQSSYIDEMVEVLRDKGTPLHFREIASSVKALLNGNQEVSGHNIHAVVQRRQDIFVWVGQGTYGLVEWGMQRPIYYVDLINNILEVSEILRDRCYTGNGAYGKLTRRGNRLVPADNPVSLSYPQIIDDDLFECVQQRLLENKQGNRGSTRPDRTYILQHIGRCGVCGGRLCCTTNGMGYRYIYCLNQRRFPHIYQCYKPQNWKLGLVEDYISAEVEDTLHNYRNNTYDLLLDRFENAKGAREQQIATAKQHLEDLKWEKQRILTTIRKGYVTDAEAEIQLTAINSEREYWEQELTNLQALQDNDNIALDAFMVQLKQLDKMFDYGFYLSPEQEKELLNVLFKEFVLYRDGRIELRFKLPVNEKQVADTVLTLSRNDTTFGNNNYEAIPGLTK